MDLQTINTLWRPVYGKLMKGVNVLTPEWQRLRRMKNMGQQSMRAIYWPVELVNGGGIAFTTNGGSTARATSNEPPEAQDSWVHLTGRFEAGYDDLDADSNSKFRQQQIEKQLNYQAKDKLRSFRRTIAAGFYGHPDNIRFLAEGTATNPSGNITRVTVEDLYGVTGLAPKRIRDYFTAGKDRVALHDGTTDTINGYGIVVAIDEANSTIDVDVVGGSIEATVAAGDAITHYNQVLTDGVSDLDLGLNGMLHLTRSQVVHSLDRDDYPDWAAGVDESGYGAALSGSDLYQWFETIKQMSDHPVTWAWSTVEAIAAGGGPELDQRRYGADDDTMRLGFKKLNAMGVGVEGTPYCPQGHLFMGSDTALMKLSPDEADVEDVIDTGDKAGSFKQYENTLGFYKDMVLRVQLCAVSRLGLGVVSGVTEA